MRFNLTDNKIKRKMEIQWGVVLFVDGQSKGSTLGYAAFLMKFILKQYEQKSATHVFIWVLPLFSIKKYYLCISGKIACQIGKYIIYVLLKYGFNRKEGL